MKIKKVQSLFFTIIICCTACETDKNKMYTYREMREDMGDGFNSGLKYKDSVFSAANDTLAFMTAQRIYLTDENKELKKKATNEHYYKVLAFGLKNSDSVDITTIDFKPLINNYARLKDSLMKTNVNNNTNYKTTKSLVVKSKQQVSIGSLLDSK